MSYNFILQKFFSYFIYQHVSCFIHQDLSTNKSTHIPQHCFFSNCTTGWVSLASHEKASRNQYPTAVTN